MIRILLGSVSLDAEHGGGTAQRTRFLARYLARAGADCQVVTMEDGDLARDLRADGIPVYVTGFLKLPYHVPLLNPRRIDGLVGQADVLHLLGYWNLLSIALASSARRQRRPYLLSAAGEFAALDLRHPVKLAFHRLFGRQMIAGARGLIAITEREQAEIVGRFGLSPGRVLVLPNGVEPVSDERATDDRLPKQPFVLFMGRLAPIKGPDLLLEAFARVANRFTDVILVFAGPDGGLLHALERRRAELGLEDRVVYTGFVDERARNAAYQGACLLVVPSRDEAMSLVAIEAGAHATPVIVTDRCGFDEVQAIGGGRVVPASIEGLAGALADLLTAREELPAMGSALRTYVRERYTWPKLAGRLLQYCAENGFGENSDRLP